MQQAGDQSFICNQMLLTVADLERYPYPASRRPEVAPGTDR
jgi:hypothetical protein